MIRTPSSWADSTPWLTASKSGYVPDLLGEIPDRWVWLGGAVIFGSTLYIAHRENAAARKAKRGEGADGG